jgi:chaperone required for assembly of F1-ATPase
MKRFYKEVVARPAAGGWDIALDGRPVRTPARAPLVVPSEALGEAVAAEWHAQQGKVDPRSMPLTGLANAAIDRIAPDSGGFARGLALYGESDLLCYRAEDPPSLVARQSEQWDPLIAWARRRFDVDFEIVSGIVHRAQPSSTIERLRHAVAAHDLFELAALAPLVTISGSLLIALALSEGAIDVDTAWAAATLDEAFQAEHWGEDQQAAAALEVRRGDFEAADRFLKLL